MQPDDYFEFEGFRFYPHQHRLLRLRDRMPFALTPKQSDLLKMLVEKAGEIVTYEEIKTAIWGGGGAELDQNIRELMRTLRSKLGKSEGQKIETVSGRGYRLTSTVVYSGAVEADAPATPSTDDAPVASAEEPEKEEESEHQSAEEGEHESTVEVRLSDRFIPPYGEHFWQILASCALYALLYSIALFIEIAYQFDSYKGAAWTAFPLVFLWIFSTSVAGLTVGAKWTWERKITGMGFTLLVFVIAALCLYLSVGLFLPGTPITEARFQTYTAHGAYLKDIYYFLPVAVVYMVLPIHFVAALERELRDGNDRLNRALLLGKRWGVTPRGMIFLRVWWLVVLLLGLAAAALVATTHLFENLKPNTNMNLFMQLAQWRLVLCFALGLECVIWYHWSLNELKREYLQRM